MGILHRLFGARTRDVWRAEARLLHRLGYVHPPEAVQWISTSVCDLSLSALLLARGQEVARRADHRRGEDASSSTSWSGSTGRCSSSPAARRCCARTSPQVIEYAHRRGVPWAIHTHGGRVEQHLDTFAKYPPVMAAISLDGPRDYHDQFRGKVGSFDAAIRAMKALKRIGVSEVVAGTTINRQNADLLADMVDDVFASGADSWGFHLMTPEGRAQRTPGAAADAATTAARRRLRPSAAGRVSRRAGQRVGRRRAAMTASIATAPSPAGPAGSRASSPRPAR